MTDLSIPMIAIVPYNGRTHLAVSGEAIYTLWSEDLLVREYDMDGGYQRAFYYPVNKRVLSRAEVLEDFEYTDERQLQMVRTAALPETWPPVRNFLLDDEQRFWISTDVDNPDGLEWLVLQETGELITRFTWPEERDIRVIRNGYAYTLEEDEMGVVQVVRYRIELG